MYIEKNKKIDQSINPELVAIRELEDFVYNPGLIKLVALFVGREELPKDTSERLLYLQEIAKLWDFRNGNERMNTDWSDNLFDDNDSEEGRIIFEAANDLGLIADTMPKNKKPNYLIILGGGNRAPLDRLKYGLDCVDDFSYLAYLGSSRVLSDQEKSKVREYAPDAKTEFDLGCSALELYLRAQQVHDISLVRDGDIWGMRLYEYVFNDVKKYGFALSTPQQIGERRANTYDNFRFFADRAELANNSDQSVLSVTTGLYSAAQHLVGVQELTLKYGINLETIGHSAAYTGVTRKPKQLLQEIKAAIDAAVKLEKAIKSTVSSNLA